MTAFDPNDLRAQVEHYLSRALGEPVCLVEARPLAKSTRAAPWRLTVEMEGTTRAYVLRRDGHGLEHEYQVLRAMETVPIPTPGVYGWDPKGKALGAPSFFSDFVKGESLLKHMKAGEAWADALYIETACALQAITWEQLAGVSHRFGQGESAADWLERIYGQSSEARSNLLAGAVHDRLRATMPKLPEPRFSNGDLYPDNLIVQDRKLAGVIDFEHSGFTDPLYEFLLPFFVCPELRGRGLEERYCRHMDLDPASLPWYHALEYFDTWLWTLRSGQAFEQHTEESCRRALEQWLSGGEE